MYAILSRDKKIIASTEIFYLQYEGVKESLSRLAMLIKENFYY